MLTGPLYMLQVYDRVLASQSVPTLIALSLLMIGLYAFLWLFEHVRYRIAARIGAELDAELGERTFRVWLGQGLYGDAGQKQKPLNDLNQLRSFLSGMGPIAIFDLPWIPIYIAVIFALHWVLGVIAIIGTIIILIAAIFNEYSTRKPLDASSQQKRAGMDFAQKAHRNADAINAMGMGAVIGRRWGTMNDNYSERALVASDKTGSYSAFSKSFRLMLQSGILGVGAALAVVQIVTPGTMIAASIIMGRALAPVQMALGQWKFFILARQAYGRLKDFYHLWPAQDEHLRLTDPEGTLQVAGMSASAPGKQVLILRDVNFDLKPGDALGIIGPSGSGKSTLAKLLTGLWMPRTGTVRLDGATFNQWNKDELGRHIGYLPQNVELLDGTISENISRFYPNANSKDIITAAKRAGVHDLILNLRDGYDSVLGNGETVLSAGQVQRIGLARALYGDPVLVVLDEPNSNLDVKGDQALTAAVADLADRGKTVIIITHRPSALSAVDLVLMLSDGRQIAFGPKDEVLRPKPQPKIAEKKAPVRLTHNNPGKPFSMSSS